MMLHRRLLPIVRGFNRNSIIRASSARDSGYQTYSSSSSSSSRAPPSSSSSPPPNYDKDGEDEPRNRVDISADDNQVLRQFDNRSFNTVIKIDKSALNQKTYRHASEQSPPGKEPETPLVSELKARIKGGGPISVSMFMTEALLHPNYGYYTTAGVQDSKIGDQRIFGSEGDFVTSPELSQMFGELIGLWCMSMWDKLGRPNNLHLVELGPGKGTLMYDVMRTTRRDSSRLSAEFHEFQSHIAGVHMIEASPELRKIQMDKLRQESTTSDDDDDAVRTFGNVPVHWHTSFNQIPSDGPILLIAHEFFDALPVHQFQYTERGWCEVVVDVDDDPNSEYHFKFVLAPGKSWASVFLKLVEAPKVEGTRLELSPLGMSNMEQITRRISSEGGAALIIDYGHEDRMGFTLQGIRKHAFVHPLSNPGIVDLSTYVDFGALRDIVSRYMQETPPGVNSERTVVCHGPQTQRNFLLEMGIDARLVSLLKNPNITDQDVEHLTYAYERLTSETDMGTRFKVMAVSEALPNGEQPTGFEICPPLEP